MLPQPGTVAKVCKGYQATADYGYVASRLRGEVKFSELDWAVYVDTILHDRASAEGKTNRVTLHA